MDERRARLAATILSGITVFSYLLYLVGRVYWEAYLSVLNIPIGIFNYTTIDYIFIGARPDNLLIVLLYTSLIGGLFLFLFFKQFTNSRKRVETISKIIGYAYFVYSVFATIFIAVLILFTITPNKVALAAVFPFTLFPAIWFWLIFTEKELLSWIKRKGKRFLPKIFVVATIIYLIVFPYLCGTCWGALRGLFELDKSPFGYKSVELYSTSEIIADIEWEKTADNYYKTTKDLQLLFSNDKYLVLRTSDNASAIHIVKTDDILLFNVLVPQK
jgi:hypothetical protein